ncbi:hypothetical protein VIGAN_05162600 [Vigna angularis var. angularis]|uniref:Uncharacterized protein n=1 Tax=Vigna angularis var. angularis TaxID=157739 RepID=A0A0S3S5R4_PHAAN|nr:DNA polymerase II subunit B4 isoform X2 [Vigna angularis]BAT88180.1 hypothetical protein VIGAN_05162600 [Vigna angularis var. angularis]
MLSLRRERVEKQNSRGEIVRKEQVTMTKKLNASNKAQAKKPEWPPSKAVLLSNPYKQFPPQGRQLDYIKEKDLGYLISELLKRRQQGTTSTDSDVEDVEGSDVEDVEGSDAEDTNSEEFEADDDTNSEKSEDGVTNSEESQAESSNSESEADEAEDEDISSEESQVESSNSEESEVDEAEDEDIGSEESEAQDINSEESSEEVEDSDDEPPRPLIDINGSERNLPTGRIFTDIDQCINNSLLKKHLMDFNPERNNLFNGRAEIRISRLKYITPSERHSWIEE